MVLILIEDLQTKFLSVFLKNRFFRGHQVNFCKNEKNLTKEWKQPSLFILQQAVFFQYVFSILVAKNQRYLRTVQLNHQRFVNFRSLIFLKSFNHGYRTIRRKVLGGCFRSLQLLIAFVKMCAERCTLQLYLTSLKSDSQKQFYLIQ